MRENTSFTAPSEKEARFIGAQATEYQAFYPPQTASYVERHSEKKRLLKILTHPGAFETQSTSVLYGQNGSGKSSLARSLLTDERIQTTFSDGVYWIDVGPNPYDLAHQLNLIGTDITTKWKPQVLIPELMAQFHATCSERSILIIFDNVWDVEQALQFRPPGTNPTYKALFTTRNERIADALKAPRVSLGTASLEMAVGMLGICNAQAADASYELAKRLHHHPRALGLARALNRQDGAFVILNSVLPAYDSTDEIEGVFSRLFTWFQSGLTNNETAAISALQLFPTQTPIARKAVEKCLGTHLDEKTSAAVLKDLSSMGLIATRRFSDAVVFSDELISYFPHPESPTRPDLHRAFLALYNPSNSDWSEIVDDGHIYRFLLAHLEASGQAETLKSLLLDFAWIKAKIKASGPVALHEDYNRVREDKTLRVVQEAIRLATPILARDKTQLGSQLIGRLQDMHIPALRDLVQSIRLSPPDREVWLDPYKTHLRVPDTALLQTYTGHRDVIHAIAIDAEGQHAYSASEDHTIRAWDLLSGNQLTTFDGHQAGIHLLRLTPDNRHILSCAEDNTISVWDIKRKKRLYTHRIHDSKILSLQPLPDNQHALSSDEDGRFLYWEIASGKIIKDMAIPAYQIWAIDVDPDGKRAFTGGDENIVRVWDLERGVCRHILSAHEDWIWCLKVTRNGKYLLSGSEDRTIVVWDLEEYKATRVLKGHQGAVRSIDLSYSGREMVSASEDQSMIEWDFSRGVIQRSFTGHDDWVWDIAVTPDGKGVLTASDDTSLKLWSLTRHTNKHQQSDAHDKGVRALAVSPDNHSIVSASDDASLKQWRLDAGRLQSSLTGHSDWIWDLQVIQDGKYGASASFDYTVSVWDLASQQRKYILKGHEDWVWSLAMTSDDRYLFSGSEDTTIKMWDIESGLLVRTFNGHEGGITRIVVTDDDQYLISASQDHSVRVWQIDSGALLHVLAGHRAPVRALVLSPLHQRVASASDDGSIRLWNYKEGQETELLLGHKGSVRHLALTGLGMQLISASEDLTLRIWDIALAKEELTLRGHEKEIRGMTVSRDGRIVASVSDDDTLRLWHLHTGELMAIYYADFPITCCHFTIDDQRIVAGDAGGGLHFLRIDEMLLFTQDFSL